MFAEEIKKGLSRALKELGIGVEESRVTIEHPADFKNGDYSSSVAMALSKFQKRNPRQLADEIVTNWQEIGLPDFVEKVEVAGTGFVNIWLKIDALGKQQLEVLNEGDGFGKTDTMAGEKIMVEFAHPNTHKELHIGHMRTLITGEALARIFSACGAEVFRANYQGDIGPHVAKAIWGTEKLLGERGLTWEKAEELSLTEKAHLLGEGYVRGNQDYEQFEKEIDELNAKLYKKDPQVMPAYKRTRRWSLQYYDSFYTRFLTSFDRLFFESEVAEEGKKIVTENIGRVFEKSEGAVIFNGEKYACLAEDGESRWGLHKRVFITADGNPTYEGKEMALAYKQFEAFPFDLNIHVVGSDQADYFKVVIKALETLDPKFVGKEFHLSMGMVKLIGKKMSSRTGVILKVDDLLDEVKSLLKPLIQDENLPEEQKEKIAEVLTIASVKYSMLKVNPTQDVVFDPEKSVSLQGDSGPYLEYTYARTQSVLAKNQKSKVLPCRQAGKNQKFGSNSTTKPAFAPPNRRASAGKQCSNEEIILLRTLYRFPEVVAEAAKKFSPNILCNFLFDLAQKFNLFYDKHWILGSNNEEFRLLLTVIVGQVLKNGLNFLGIEALEKM